MSVDWERQAIDNAPQCLPSSSIRVQYQEELDRAHARQYSIKIRDAKLEQVRRPLANPGSALSIRTKLATA
jgi:hypothetical protein